MVEVTGCCMSVVEPLALECEKYGIEPGETDRFYLVDSISRLVLAPKML